MSLAPYFLISRSLFDPDPNKRIQLGSLVQLSNSFDKVFGAMNTVAENWAHVNTFRATARRLRTFERHLQDRPSTATRTRFARMNEI